MATWKLYSFSSIICRLEGLIGSLEGYHPSVTDVPQVTYRIQEQRSTNKSHGNASIRIAGSDINDHMFTDVESRLEASADQVFDLWSCKTLNSETNHCYILLSLYISKLLLSNGEFSPIV